VDGTTKDRFVDGRLFRSASIEQAVEEYPPIVVLLACTSACVSFQTSADGIKHVILYKLTNPNIKYKLRVDDYSRCVDVARRMGQFPIFPTEPTADIIGRIQALLRVEFADRGEF